MSTNIKKILFFTLTIIVITSLTVYLVMRKSKEKKYNIYVINLARRRDRMVKFGSNYDLETPYEIFDAVDGKNLSLEDLYKEGKIGNIGLKSILNVTAGEPRKYHHELTSLGAVGCTLSHINIWDKVSNSNDSNPTIIFEDDALVTNIKLKDLDKRINSLPDDWDIYMIGKPHTMLETKKVNSNLLKVNRFCGTHAYVISENGIKKLFDKKYKLYPINQQIDSYLSELSMDYDFNIYMHSNKPMIIAADNTTDIQISNKGVPVTDGRLRLDSY